MSGKKTASFVCGVMAILSLLGGMVCFFAPLIDKHVSKTEGIAESIAGMCMCFISIVWFIIARLLFNSAVKEEQQGERAFLLSV